MKQKADVGSAVSIDDNWRRWIAENLILGCAPAFIAGQLQQGGISAAQARDEIDLAMRSPYLQGAPLTYARESV